MNPTVKDDALPDLGEREADHGQQGLFATSQTGVGDFRRVGRDGAVIENFPVTSHLVHDVKQDD